MVKSINSNTANNKYKYKVSFVIPVYNAEKYLEETVGSLLKQDIGFESNCEIILVDDGSTDGSADLCKKIVATHPNNITYVYQKNAGPGAARNKGIELAKGQFINPIDSDDKLSENATSEAVKFFDEHPDINIVGLKWELFDARTGSHPLNYRFRKHNRIVNLKEDYQDFQGSVAPAFFRAHGIKSHKFDPKIGLYSEDARYMAELLLKNQRYGALASPTYYYRKRQDQTSSQDKNQTDKFWYLKTPKLVWLDLLKKVSKDQVSIPKFLQYMVMYDLQWRIKQRYLTPLDDKEKLAYKKILKEILQYVDDEIIFEQRNMFSEHKIFTLCFKYEKPIEKILTTKNNKVYVKNTDIEVINYNKNGFMIEILESTGDHIIVEGYTKGIFMNDSRIYMKIIGSAGQTEYIKAESINRPLRRNLSLEYEIYNGGGFRLKIPKERIQNSSIIPVVVNGENENILQLSSGFHARLPQYYKFGISFLVLDDLIVSRLKNALYITPKTKLGIFKKEMKVFTLLTPIEVYRKLKDKRIAGVFKRLSVASQWGMIVMSSLMIRLIFYLTLPFITKQIWLITDRIKWADDNGEVLYDYLRTQPKNRFSAFFAIDKNTEDYKRIKNKGGRVVHYFGVMHQVITLHAHKLISSEATEATLNPFGEKYVFLQGLLKYEFIFPQHGIIRDDLSGWVNKYSKNIKLFTTSAPLERKSIINDRYGYSSDKIVLTGNPRSDLLMNSKEAPQEKVLAIMPTWRANIVGTTSYKTNIREYNPLFKESEFYKFYTSIIQDKDINTALKKQNASAVLYLHHALQSQIQDFNASDRVKIGNFPHDYKTIKNESSVIVTDYSSVAFDFAYLNKPVIYTQFDDDTFYENNPSSRGYFDYGKDGFGPVCYDFKSSKKAIMNLIKSNFKQNKIYEKRAKAFFYKIDQNNSRRVYQAILEMKDRNEHIKRVVIPHSKKNSSKKVKTFWWRYRPPAELNFGDEITAYIVQSLFGIECEPVKPEEAEMIGTGSILELLKNTTNNQTINVWGAGFIEDGGVLETPADLKYHAVRGKLTRARIATKDKVALGDPGLLVSKVFKRAKKSTYKIGIVLHYIDQNNSLIEKYQEKEDILFIDPLQTPDKVALDITSCKIILSSSLHGLIFADSYEIPNYWMPVSSNVYGGDYKFRDHYSASDRKLIKITPKVIDDAAEIERLIESYEPINDLVKVQMDLIDAFPYSKNNDNLYVSNS